MWLPCKPVLRRVLLRVARARAWLGRVLAVALLLSAAPATALDIHERMVTRAQWPQHANGLNIAALPAIRKTLRRFAENDNITIVIHHPGGDPGRQWARELHDWLVSFGVPIRYLELQLGSGGVDQLVVSVIERS